LQGDYHQAVNQYKTAINIDPRAIEPRFCLATLYDKHDMYDEAAEEYQLILEINPKHTKALHNLGRIHFQYGDYAEALKSFQHVLKLQPENTDAWNDLGSVYEITNNVIQAISTYRKALGIDPFHEETNFNLANAHFSLFLSSPNIVNIEDIIKRLNFILSRNPHNKKVQELLNKIKGS
jgi:tetratricopeptide (TPR) repeat protein